MLLQEKTFDSAYRPVLERLLTDQRALLGEQLIGLILHGSLATGDFVPDRSDIDFVAVTAGDLPEDVLPRLEAMHVNITSSGLPGATVLEGSYIPRDALRRYDPAYARYPALRTDGSFAVDGHGIDAIIQRWVMRAHGIALYGPLPASLIDPIPVDDLRRAARGILEEWWRPQLTDTHRLQSAEYQAYAVLTMCRALYTLDQGTVVAKAAAARWTQARHPQWVELITGALAWRHGDPLDRLAEVLAFVWWTLEKTA